MTYEWEAKAKAAHLRGELPDHFRVIGVAVENTGTGEAALIMMEEPDGSVIDADCWQNVLGDAGRHYYKALNAAFSGRPKK